MKRKDILFLLITTAIFVFVWIVFSVYHNLLTSTIPEILSIQISPISSNFDTKTLDQLKNREKFEPIFESAIILSVTPSPVSSSSSSTFQVQTASPSATSTSLSTSPLSPTSSATSGGTLAQ